MSSQDYPLQYEERHKAQKIQLLEEDNKELREREKNLKRINEQFSKLLESLQSELETTRNKMKETERLMRDSQLSVEKCQEENRLLRKAIEEYSQLEVSRNRNCESEQLKSEIEKTKLREEIGILRQQLESVHKREVNMENMKQREQILRIRQMEYNMMTATLQRRLKQQTQFHEESTRKYETQLKKLQLRIDELQDKRIEKENHVADLYSQFKQIQIENGCLVKKISVLEGSIQQEREKARGKYAQELQTLRKENDSLKQQIKYKELEHRVASQQSKKIILNEKAKITILQDAANKMKNNYEQKSSLIIKQLLSKDQKICSLQRKLSRSRSKNMSRGSENMLPQGSPSALRLTYDTLSESYDKLSTGQTSMTSSVTHKDTSKVNRQLFHSRENRKIEFTVEKNPYHKCK